MSLSTRTKQRIIMPDKWILVRNRKTRNLEFKPCIKKAKK